MNNGFTSLVTVCVEVKHWNDNDSPEKIIKTALNFPAIKDIRIISKTTRADEESKPST